MITYYNAIIYCYRDNLIIINSYFEIILINKKTNLNCHVFIFVDTTLVIITIANYDCLF